MPNPPQSREDALEELRRVTVELSTVTEGRDHLVEVRNRVVRSAHNAGASLRAIGEACGLSKDGIKGILNK